MIVPNLMVTDMPRSVAFYRDVLGMEVRMAVSDARDMLKAAEAGEAMFVTLGLGADELMLQTAGSLAAGLDVFSGGLPQKPGSTIYFRGLHPSKLDAKKWAPYRISGPMQQWYGMLELYLQDPDGHVICAGAPEGAPPA